MPIICELTSKNTSENIIKERNKLNMDFFELVDIFLELFMKIKIKNNRIYI